MNLFVWLVTVYSLVTLGEDVDALNCYICSYTHTTCRDEVFQDYNQTSADCGVGSCVKTKYFKNESVERFCDPLYRWNPGCISTLDGTMCFCHYKDNCNGPVGVEGATEGGLQCYDCYLNNECSDKDFNEFPQVLVNCGTGSCVKSTVLETDMVHRHCSPERLPVKCVDDTFDGKASVTCACHDEDGCNDATKIRIWLITYSIPFMILFSY